MKGPLARNRGGHPRNALEKPSKSDRKGVFIKPLRPRRAPGIGFHVPVHDAQGMQVRQRRQQAQLELHGFRLCAGRPLHPLEEVVLAELHGNEPALLTLRSLGEDAVQDHHVGMALRLS